MSDKWDKYFISVARLTAGLSYAKKLQVGAVAVKDKRIICTGYNGTLPGTDNCCEHEIKEWDHVNNKEIVRLKTKETVEHAERNLIAYAARTGVALKDATLYITHSPCEPCARAIVNAGFTRILYIEDYKKDGGLIMLRQLGVEVQRMKVD